MSDEPGDDVVDRARALLIRDGFVVLRQLLPAQATRRARDALAQQVHKHLVKARRDDAVCADLPLADRLACAYADAPDACPTSWVAELSHSFAFHQLLFRDAALLRVVSALTGGRTPVVSSRWNCRVKLPDAPRANFAWHQDHAYFRMQHLLRDSMPKRVLAVWAPLVSVDGTNGGIEFSAGSHVRGLLAHRISQGNLAVSEEAFRSHDSVVPTLAEGDVVLFSDVTLHRSGLSRSASARLSADWAFELEESDAICPSLRGEPPR